MVTFYQGDLKKNESACKNKRILGFKGFLMYAVAKNILELTSVLLFIQVSLLHHRLDNYSFDRRSPKGFLEKKAWKISQNSSGDIFGDIRKGICHRCPLLGMFCKFPEQVLIKIITGTLAQGPLATFFWCLQCIMHHKRKKKSANGPPQNSVWFECHFTEVHGKSLRKIEWILKRSIIYFKWRKCYYGRTSAN